MRVRYISPVERSGRPFIARNATEQKIIHEDVALIPDVGVNIFAWDGEDARVASHWHEELELFYVKRSRGPVKVVIDGSLQSIGQDDLILFNSGEIHEIAGGIVCGIVLQIPVRFWEQFVPEYEQLIFSLQQIDKRRLSAVKCTMVVLYDIYQKKGVGYRLQFNSLLCKLMYDLVKFCSSEVKPPAEHARRKKIADIAEVIDYIELHHAEKLTVAAVASRFGYHPNYLSRLFQQSVGHTVLEYIYTVRIYQVYCELLYTDKAVRRIFEDHGCTNSKVAMRMFKEVYQATPREIRKRKLSETDKS